MEAFFLFLLAILKLALVCIPTALLLNLVVAAAFTISQGNFKAQYWHYFPYTYIILFILTYFGK